MHGTWALAVAPIAWQLNSQAAETKKPQLQSNYGFYFGGLGRNRTTDTRIFNPLLYRLSYRAKPQIIAVDFQATLNQRP